MKAFADGQSPMAAVMFCSDSRVPPEHVCDQGIGDLLVGGNVSGPSEPASVAYVVEHLGVPLLLVGAVYSLRKGEVEVLTEND